RFVDLPGSLFAFASDDLLGGDGERLAAATCRNLLAQLDRFLQPAQSALVLSLRHWPQRHRLPIVVGRWLLDLLRSLHRLHQPLPPPHPAPPPAPGPLAAPAPPAPLPGPPPTAPASATAPPSPRSPSATPPPLASSADPTPVSHSSPSPGHDRSKHATSSYH